MKIGIIGDLHLNNRTPERRKDDYFEASKRKMDEALKFFKEKNCAQVLQVGDFFDTPTVANKVKAETMELLLNNYKILCIYGQHDISGHSATTFLNSPLAVLKAAEFVELMGSEPYKLSESIFVYGASFGQEIPKPVDPKACNILLIHDMIGNRPLWPGQILTNPRNFLRNHPYYKMVFCGDYHYSFQDKMGDQLILNPGALMRKSLTDVKLGHEPAVCVVDTDSLEVEIKPLDIEKSELVFDLSKPRIEKDAEALNRLLEGLKNVKEENEVKLSWNSILLKVIKEKKVSKGAQKQIDSVIGELNNV